MSLIAWVKSLCIVAVLLVVGVLYFGVAPQRPAPKPKDVKPEPVEKAKTQVYVIQSEGRRFLVFESWSGDIEVIILDGWSSGSEL